MNIKLSQDLFEWWLETLKASLPVTRRPRSGTTTRRLTICKAAVELSTCESGVVQKFASPGAGDLADALRSGTSRLVIAIDSSRYIFRRLSKVRLPTSHVRAMSNFDVASATPFKPHDVHCLMLRPVDRRTMAPATYAIVKRTVLDPVLSEIKSSRAQLSGVVLLPENPVETPVWEVVATDVARLTSVQSWLKNAWTIACYALAAAVLITVLHIQGSLARAQFSAEETLPGLESKAKTIRAELDRRVARIKEINALRHSLATQRTMTEIWEELSRVLPDTAYVTDLMVRGNAVTLEGFSPEAASIIEPIESSTMFKGAEFSSAVVKVPGQDGERFQVSLEVLSR